MKEIYLDYAAATPVRPEVKKEMNRFWNVDFGNPSSFNDSGRKARKAVEDARDKIRRILGVSKADKVVFTGSGTESCNLAILGLAKKFKAGHIITTEIEHKAVLEPINYLKNKGFKITYLKVNENGLINLSDLEKAIRKDTILISIIYANNEIGTIQQIKKIGKIIKATRDKRQAFVPSSGRGGTSRIPFFHIDACQASGYLDINANNLGVDLMSLNAAKIYGPKGIGLLYVRNGTPIESLIFGGGQESKLRSGTEAVPLITGFAKALELAEKEKEKESKRLIELRDYFFNRIQKLIPEVKINGDLENRLPNNINISIPDVESEQILLRYDLKGIRASSGSACTARDLEVSHVLRAIGLNKKYGRGSLRFSMGRSTSKKDLDHVLKSLVEIIKELKKIYPEKLRREYYK